MAKSNWPRPHGRGQYHVNSRIKRTPCFGVRDVGTSAAIRPLFHVKLAAKGQEMSADEKTESDDILVEEGEVAGDYLEGLLDILDYDGDIDLDVEGDRATVTVDGSDDLKKLVGGDGKVLEALQELTRLAVQQELGSRSRLMLDISRWRAERREELASIARDTAQTVMDGGESADLSPMSPFERKVVHDTIAELDGVRSDSSGQEPHRYVVIHPV